MGAYSMSYSSMCKGSGGAVYGLGLIGAIVYYIKIADTFGQGALGLLKAVVWPAIVVYKGLGLLG